MKFLKSVSKLSSVASLFHIQVFVIALIIWGNQITGSEGRLKFHKLDHDCSVYCPITFDVSRFAGTWNYLQLFTEGSTFPPDQLFCLKLNVDVNLKGMNVSMNMTIPRPILDSDNPSPAVEILVVANIWGWVDESVKPPGSEDDVAEERVEDFGIIIGDPSIRKIMPGRFQVFSNYLASSKWILLSNWENEHLLYVSCGDFPDGTCAVAEIGILSRSIYIHPGIVHQFDLVLAKYGLHTALRTHIPHDRCLPVYH